MPGHGAQSRDPLGIERRAVEFHAAEVIENDPQIRHAFGDLGDVFQAVSAHEEIHGLSLRGGELQVLEKRIGQLLLIPSRKTIADVARVFAERFEERLELRRADDLREIAHDAAVERFVVRGDVEIPLVVGQALPGLHDDDSAHSVGRGDRLMDVREKGTIEHFVVLFDPAEPLGPRDVPEVHVAV